MKTPTVFIWDNLNAWIWGESELMMPALRTEMQGKWAICVEEEVNGSDNGESWGSCEIRRASVQGCMPHSEGDCDGR